MTRSQEVLERLYWTTNQDWYTGSDFNSYKIKDDAPEEAKKSFELWKKHNKL